MITFQNRAVAFIDLLGFKSIVCDAEQKGGQNLTELQNVVDLLKAVVPRLDQEVSPDVPPEVIPTHTYVSDSIILSAPLSLQASDGKTYDGLETIVMRSIQISHQMLRAGYLVRGGVTIGNVWHDESNIIGTAYIKAFNIEQGTSQPRIVLSEEALSHWKGTGRLDGSHMVHVYENIPMVNGLHDYYIENRQIHGSLEKTYQAYDATIKDRIADKNLLDNPKKKWRWFSNYFHFEAKRAAGWIAEDRLPVQ